MSSPLVSVEAAANPANVAEEHVVAPATPSRAPELRLPESPTSIRARLRDTLVGLLIFGGNRIVGQMPGHALRLSYYRHALGWQIGHRSSIHHGLTVFGGRGGVHIGNRSTLQIDCMILGCGMGPTLTIGDNVAIAHRVVLCMGQHDIRSPDFTSVVASITIEDYVFIGLNSVVLMGVTLGEGSVVAAGSVVSTSVPPYSIVRGNPAHVVGERPRNLNYSPESFWPFH
jgi:acetyltransferase-like isoleucine patch superfamily enzyme